MRPDYCVAFGPSLDWTDLCWVWSENDYSLFSLFFWRNKQHLLEIHACSMLHWTRVFKTNVHIWGSSCLQEQQRKSGQIRHELWTLINDKLPHPAEETQPPFSLFSPAALLSKSFSCFFVSFFHQPMSFFLCWCLLTHDRNTNTAVERRRDEDERERRTETGGNYWRHESGESWASPQELSLQFHPWPNQKKTNPVWSCVAEGSQHLHLSPASDGLMSVHADCNHQDRSDCVSICNFQDSETRITQRVILRKTTLWACQSLQV